MVDLARPLDLYEAGATEFLEGIQGNILKHHGRNHARHLFIEFTGDVAAVRAFLARFAADHVTSAAAAREQARAFRASGESEAGETFGMLALSAEGYRRLGIPDDRIPVQGQVPGDPGPDLFRAGMKNPPQGSRTFNDPPVSAWQVPYRGSIHAMLLLADDEEKRLNAVLERVRGAGRGVVAELGTEPGRLLTKLFPRGVLNIEHFGYQDGISQPMMIEQEADEERKGRGSRHWDPTAPLELAFVEDPAGGHGSFLVFRKLEQNVAGFHAALAKLAAQIGTDVGAAGAMAVGRHVDGEPTVPTSTHDSHGDKNDFDLGKQDPDGARCPFHAHIRKTNPRGDLGLEFELTRRIARRGIPYGDRPDLDGDDSAGLPSTAVGLLFMSVQANLDQFAIQQEGSDSNDFKQPGVGPDAVIGQNPDPVPATWPSTGTERFTFANFVTMRGGEYLYIPSTAFLRGLGSHDSDDGDR